MARYQQTISAILFLGSAFALFGIARALMTGWDRLTYAAWGVMFALMWLARRMILRMPVAAEAGQRVGAAPAWGELSPTRRRLLLWFDWPLFIEVREREARRLWDEPIVSATFTRDNIVLEPLEATHNEPFFLKWMANAVSQHGWKVHNVKDNIFSRDLIGDQVTLVLLGNDLRCWDYVRNRVADDTSIRLKHFVDVLEEAYLSTLTEAERYKYRMDRMW